MANAGWNRILRRICAVAVAASPILGAADLQIRDGLPVINVRVNGHGPYRFLLDTGTQLSHIDPNLAKSVGLKPTISVDVIAAASITRAPAAEGVEIEIDSVLAKDQRLVLSNLDPLRALGPDIRGLLGQEFLSQFDYLIDLRHKRIDFGSNQPAGTRTEFQLVHNRPAVATSLGRLILDSGAASVILFGGAPTRATNHLFTLAGTAEAATVPHRPLVIEGQKIRYPELVSVQGRNESGADGLLPMSLFKSVYISNSQRYAAFE